MAGFQKFRVPRRMSASYWLINKNWRMNCLSVGWASLCITFMLVRQINVSFVLAALLRTFLPLGVST